MNILYFPQVNVDPLQGSVEGVIYCVPGHNPSGIFSPGLTKLSHSMAFGEKSGYSLKIMIYGKGRRNSSLRRKKHTFGITGT